MKNPEDRQRQIIDADKDPVFYSGYFNPAGDIQWEKQDGFLKDFEQNQVNMFRVILEKKVDADEKLKGQLTGEDLSGYYTLYLEKLKITSVS